MHVATDAELAQPTLLRLVPVGTRADDEHPVRGEVGERIPVEAAQVGGDQCHVAQPGRCRCEQVGEVDAAAPDGDARQPVDDLDHAPLPAVVERGEHDSGHQSCFSGLPASTTSLIGRFESSRERICGTWSLGMTRMAAAVDPELMTPPELFGRECTGTPSATTS